MVPVIPKSIVSKGAVSTGGKFNLSKEHKLLQGEAVVYNVDPNGTPVGVGSTNVGLSTSVLTVGGTYYVIKNSDTSFSLALTKERAVVGINTILIEENAAILNSGLHIFRTFDKKRTISRIAVEEVGSNYSNRNIFVKISK